MGQLIHSIKHSPFSLRNFPDINAGGAIHHQKPVTSVVVALQV